MKKKREFDFLKGRKLQISLLKMKVTVLLLLVCVLQSMAGAYSQTAKYDISMTGGKLENVFKLIEQKGEYTFLYSIEDMDQISSVNVNVKQADLKEVLDICLANTKLTYEINGRLVIIRVKDENPKVKERVIKGVVKDRKGEPLPGVTVLVKGTAVGVATDIDGKFTMNATRDTVNLLFSFIGMKTKDSYASTTSRVISCYDEDGELAYYTAENRYKYNVLNELKNSGNMNTTNSINMNISATLDIIKGLRFETTFGYNYSSSHAESYLTERTNHIATLRGYEFGAYSSTDAEYKQSVLPHGGMLNASDNRNANYTWRNSLNYVKNFGTHLLTVMVGQECKSSKYDGLAQTLYGYLPDRGKSIMAPSATVEDINGNLMANRLYNNLTQTVVDRKSNYLSFYGALTYTYDERYVLNASIRTDASNRFGQDKSARFQPVWSVGLRWNMGREHFLEGQDFLNELSLRATYGYQGNVVENTGPDLIAYIPSGAAGISRPTGEYLLKIKSLPNPTLRWEKNRNINLGVDFVFWKNKISGSFEYYYKKGTDIVVNREVPLENGVVSMPMNGGSMENSGWELSLSFAPVRTKNFVWSLGFNTSKNYNEVTSTLATNQSWQKAVSGSLNQNGYPVSAFWAFELTGLSPENGTPVFNLSGMENNALAETDATQYMKYMGKMDPDLSAGMNTSFRYKSLSLSASFNIQVGGKKFLATMFGADMINDTPWEYNNLPKDLVNRWRKPGDELLTDIPSLPALKKGGIMLPSGSDDLYRMYNFSDTRVVNASFLRCNNISLAYNLSGKKIAGFARNIAMSLNVTNPFIIVSKDFKGKDPEVATGSQPIFRNYTLSLNISF